MKKKIIKELNLKEKCSTHPLPNVFIYVCKNQPSVPSQTLSLNQEMLSLLTATEVSSVIAAKQPSIYWLTFWGLLFSKVCFSTTREIRSAFRETLPFPEYGSFLGFNNNRVFSKVSSNCGLKRLILEFPNYGNIHHSMFLTWVSWLLSFKQMPTSISSTKKTVIPLGLLGHSGPQQLYWPSSLLGKRRKWAQSGWAVPGNWSLSLWGDVCWCYLFRF